MEKITNQKEMNIGALNAYFQPLVDFLDETQESNGYAIGWDMDSSWKPKGYYPENNALPYTVSIWMYFFVTLFL